MQSRSRNVLDIKKGATPRALKREAPNPGRVRPVRLKTRRRNQRLAYSAVVVLLIGVGIGGLGGLSHLSALAINTVQVEGATHVPQETLSQAVSQLLTSDRFELFSRANMFLYPQKEIEGALKAEYPRISSVSVRRESLVANALLVALEERKPYASWCDARKCYLLDESGFIFAEKDTAAERSYVFQGGLLPNEPVIGQTFLRGRLDTVIAMLDALTAAGFPPQVFAVDSEKDYTITLPSGLRLMASFDMSPEDIISNLSTVIAAESLAEQRDRLQYIDLRFGNRVYYQ